MKEKLKNMGWQSLCRAVKRNPEQLEPSTLKKNDGEGH
jgi:hypothetical protein